MLVATAERAAGARASALDGACTRPARLWPSTKQHQTSPRHPDGWSSAGACLQQVDTVVSPLLGGITSQRLVGQLSPQAPPSRRSTSLRRTRRGCLLEGAAKRDAALFYNWHHAARCTGRRGPLLRASRAAVPSCVDGGNFLPGVDLTRPPLL